MRAVSTTVLLVLFSLVVAQDSDTNNYNDKLNSIDTKPSVRLDPYIRKALLKALSELEENEKVIAQTESTDGSFTDDAEILKPGDENTENKATEPSKDGIQIHSFIVNGQSAFANVTSSSQPAFVDNKISIITTTAGNVENQVTATLPTQTSLNEILQTRESGSNIQQTRSISSNSQSALNDNEIGKDSTVKPTTTVSTTTTTTTTPKPTHNNDGENIEDVSKKDVQVFQAPLVAAFTVHQDAHGLPKKVIPIYQEAQKKDLPAVPLPPSNHGQILSNSAPLIQNRPLNNFNEPQVNVITQQLQIQKQLEEKQRILEEQLRFLQQQQIQQEDLLRKQQYLLQQKDSQKQQQINFEQEQFRTQQLQAERQRLQSNQNINNFQVQNLPNNIQSQFQQPHNIIRSQSSQVSIQPSISFDRQINNLPNQQQLPNREAVDFLLNLRNQRPEQFPLQENHLPHGVTNFLQPGPVRNFAQPNFNQARPPIQDDQFRQNGNGNRIFRQENGVGNFGFNQNYNRFNTFNPIFSNGGFASRSNSFNPNNDLRQLLVQTGLNGRNHEDLNIVTKVLSLNHGIPINNISNNRLSFENKRQVRN